MLSQSYDLGLLYAIAVVILTGIMICKSIAELVQSYLDSMDSLDSKQVQLEELILQLKSSPAVNRYNRIDGDGEELGVQSAAPPPPAPPPPPMIEFKPIKLQISKRDPATMALGTQKPDTHSLLLQELGRRSKEKKVVAFEY